MLNVILDSYTLKSSESLIYIFKCRAKFVNKLKDLAPTSRWILLQENSFNVEIKLTITK